MKEHKWTKNKHIFLTTKHEHKKFYLFTVRVPFVSLQPSPSHIIIPLHRFFAYVSSVFNCILLGIKYTKRPLNFDNDLKKTEHIQKLFKKVYKIFQPMSFAPNSTKVTSENGKTVIVQYILATYYFTFVTKFTLYMTCEGPYFPTFFKVGVWCVR